MRALLLAVALATAACGESRKDEPAKPKPVAFDGGLATEAAAKNMHGQRLTKVLGCTGCHGKDLHGRRFYEPYASNLTRDLRGYSDAEVERVIRQGVPKNGRD